MTQFFIPASNILRLINWNKLNYRVRLIRWAMPFSKPAIGINTFILGTQVKSVQLQVYIYTA